MLCKRKLTSALAAAAMLVAISGCGGAKPARTGSTGSGAAPLADVTAPTNEPAPAPTTTVQSQGPAPATVPAGGTKLQATPATGAVAQPAPARQAVAQPTAPATQPASQPAKQPSGTASPQAAAPVAPTPPTAPAPPVTTPPSTTTPQSGSLTFTTIGRGQQSSGTERRAVLVQSEGAMSAQGIRSQQAVDFNQEAVLVVYMGEQNTGGYSVEITGVKLEGGKLVVTVKQTRPSPNAMVTQALTQPYHAVKMPKVPAGTQVSVNWL